MTLAGSYGEIILVLQQLSVPSGITKKDIEDKLDGSVDPLKAGFSNVLSDESVKVAYLECGFQYLISESWFFPYTGFISPVVLCCHFIF